MIERAIFVFYRTMQFLLPRFVRRAVQYFMQLLVGHTETIMQISSRVERIDFAATRQLQEMEARLAYLENKLAIARPSALPEVLIGQERWHTLLEEGHGDFPGGLYNPGAVAHEGRALLLARGELYSEVERAQDRSKMDGGAVPVLLESGLDLREPTMRQLQVRGLPSKFQRIEDFRLLHFRGELFASHSAVECGMLRRLTGGKFPIAQVISRVDLEGQCLEFMGRPSLGRTLMPQEKNWTYAVVGEELYLFYMFSPHYVVYKLEDWETLQFRPVIDEAFEFLSGRFGFVSYSTNPVVFDDEHLFVIVHARMSTGDKTYMHWGILINRKTLQPTFATQTPILKGGGARGVYKNVVFASGVFMRDKDFVITFGQGDFHCSHATVSKKELSEAMVPISPHRWHPASFTQTT
jgi:predicted GH43/DUF377 family glycosyl hydrolase